MKKSFVLLLFIVVMISGLAGAQEARRVEQVIRVHPGNAHYFLWRGKAVALITSGEHYGAVLNGDFNYHKYLETLEREGMNYTRLFGGSYVEVPGKSFGILRNDLAPAAGRFVAPWARSERAGYAGGGNKFDLEKWNPEYFSRLRDFLGEAERRGIVVEITLFSSQYGEMQWEVSPLNRANNLEQTDAMVVHVSNFLDCMRSRQKPTLDVDTGARAQVLITMAVHSYREGKVLYFDEKNWKIVDKPVKG